jgi:hypothetical protein
MGIGLELVKSEHRSPTRARAFARGHSRTRGHAGIYAGADTRAWARAHRRGHERIRAHTGAGRRVGGQDRHRLGGRIGSASGSIPSASGGAIRVPERGIERPGRSNAAGQLGAGRVSRATHWPVVARMLARRNAKRASLTAGPLFVCAAGETVRSPAMPYGQCTGSRRTRAQ